MNPVWGPSIFPEPVKLDFANFFFYHFLYYSKLTKMARSLTVYSTVFPSLLVLFGFICLRASEV